MTLDIRKTPIRVEALEHVGKGRIRYTARTGAFSDASGEPITGATRRTFAELRRAGAITAPADADATAMTLTEEGKALLKQWALAN